MTSLIRKAIVLICMSLCALCAPMLGQALGNAGTIEGTVTDPTGAAVPHASITIRNPITGYRQSTATAHDGTFRLVNVPPNPYHLEIAAPGFNSYSEDVSIRSAVPLTVKAALTLSGTRQELNVEGGSSELVEIDPSAHVDADRGLLTKLPYVDPAAGLSEAITYSTGGVAADANGFFHPLGDHAQVSFVIDGQVISDQQSKLYSTQLPTSAVQGMELTTGTPAAEYGDKTSLIDNITTRSGLGSGRVFGNVDARYGSFGDTGGDVALGYGTAKFGEFITIDGTRTGRFLDTPEFTPFHDKGNNGSIFDRIDYQPGTSDTFHLNLFAARNWFQIPNDYDQLSQDQHQRVLTWSIAPGYQHTFGPTMLLTVNPFVREDEVTYYGSRDFFADTPATQNQARHLLNWGANVDLAISKGRHSIKFGTELKQTRLREDFGFGVTDPAFNSPCIDAGGSSIPNITLTRPAQCAAAGFQPNTADNPLAGTPFAPGLLPYDLTRGGSLFLFHDTGNVNQAGFYVEDSIAAGNWNFTPGLRIDRYDGLSTATGVEPRVGIAYNIKKSGTVLRAAYARTLETPFNENLLLSSATGMGGLTQNVFGSTSEPLQSGHRNQFNTGFQQSLGRYLLVDADYFWKYTDNAYDFSTLLNTTITFPIAWHNSKLDGVTGRVSTTDLHGFQAYWTFGHTRARYFPPEVGGLIPQGAPLANGVFRIDHDQAFQSNVVLRYQYKKYEWASFIWRFDSGLVVSGVPDSLFALTSLTPNQQVSIGLSCGGYAATYGNGGLSPAICGTLPVRSTLITLPQAGQENNDHNPDRVQPRNVFNVGIGTDNLTHREKRTRIAASLEVANLLNKMALYNFLSTFSGTHFLQPRTVVARIGLVF